VLARYGHLETIASDPLDWGLGASRAARLAESLGQQQGEALLYRQLARLREDVPLAEKLGDLEWRGAFDRLNFICHRLGDENLPGRIPRWRQV
jgi:hypothetical protein